MSLFSKIFGDPNEKAIKKLEPTVSKINELEGGLEGTGEEVLRGKTEEFKRRFKNGEKKEGLLPEAFSLVREAAKRTLNQRHFDVQLTGGIVLHQGKIAEMKTGEGKTLASTLAIYLNALSGKGVHVVTVNDYLAKRDTVWMGQIYHLLGLSVACIVNQAAFVYDPHFKASPREGNEKELPDEVEKNAIDKKRDTLGAFHIEEDYLRPAERKEAYAAAITYGTNNEFGFDYLRDNMAYRPEDKVQRDLHYAIIDEIDSILIDEARTPLIISAPDTESTQMYKQFSGIVPGLKENEHYNVDEKMKAVSLTEEGIEEVERKLGLKDIYTEKGIRYVHHLEQALRAQILFKKDRDYVVREGEVIIVDEFTGRLMPGRRYSEGLHQAIEAKEGVEVRRESRTLATITFQNYFRMYDKLAGMTGTAVTSAEEFAKVYGLEVVVIPTNRPLQRTDRPDRIYKTQKGKFEAVAREIEERHKRGQPVLVGTVSIERNEVLSVFLRKAGVPHEILNAKNHEKEGQIIAQAGRKGAVTVATNMAGRGVDIVLGGNPPNPEEAEEVKRLGGLFVIGTERHEARRIDNQLRGRSGRQGDPGESQFFVSLEDDLMRVFGSEKIGGMMERLGVPEDQPIENKFLSGALEKAQGRVEGHHFDARKHILDFDEVLNKHREVIYRKRNEIISKKPEEIRSYVTGVIKDEFDKIVNMHVIAAEQSDIEELAENVRSIIPGLENLRQALENLYSSREPEKSAGKIREYLFGLLDKVFEARDRQMGEEAAKQVDKAVILRSIDTLWMDHLETMASLRDSVRLRAYGQKDPLVEYKNEGKMKFEELLATINLTIATTIFKVHLSPPQKFPGQDKSVISTSKSDSSSASASVSNSKPKPKNEEGEKVSRNDPCPCGSGRKYKKCHGS